MSWQTLLRNKKTAGVVKNIFKPNVGSLTKTRAVQDDLVKSIDKGKKIKGKEEVKEILMKQSSGKKLHELVKKLEIFIKEMFHLKKCLDKLQVKNNE